MPIELAPGFFSFARCLLPIFYFLRHVLIRISEAFSNGFEFMGEVEEGIRNVGVKVLVSSLGNNGQSGFM